MRARIPIILLCAFFLQGCSWIDAFYIINKTDKPLAVEIKLNETRPSSGIFFYDKFSLFDSDKKLNHETRKEVAPTILNSFSHIMVVVPAHYTLEIGSMMNTSSSIYNQKLASGDPDFNLKELWIKRPGEEIKITPATFNDYFKSGDLGKYSYAVGS